MAKNPGGFSTSAAIEPGLAGSPKAKNRRDTTLDHCREIGRGSNAATLRQSSILGRRASTCAVAKNQLFLAVRGVFGVMLWPGRTSLLAALFPAPETHCRLSSCYSELVTPGMDGHSRLATFRRKPAGQLTGNATHAPSRDGTAASSPRATIGVFPVGRELSLLRR